MGRPVLHPGTLGLLDNSAWGWFLLGTAAIGKLHRDAGEVGEGECLRANGSDLNEATCNAFRVSGSC
ncbi:MAG: hypothetical protein JWQ87_2228 [Candidatus Sulfotelmatobacter sp.]|nr:hypothetical protein [Candidatus Sulfotelmatobacter sp.]